MNYQDCEKCAATRAAGNKTESISQNIPGGVPVEREVVVSVVVTGEWKHECMVCGYVWLQTPS